MVSSRLERLDSLSSFSSMCAQRRRHGHMQRSVHPCIYIHTHFDTQAHRHSDTSLVRIYLQMRARINTYAQTVNSQTFLYTRTEVICIRDRQNVRKLKAQLPPLEPGLCCWDALRMMGVLQTESLGGPIPCFFPGLTMTVDLDNLQMQFVISSNEGAAAIVRSAPALAGGLFPCPLELNLWQALAAMQR